MKAELQRQPMTIQELAEVMQEEFELNYKYVWNEVQELIGLGKIEEHKYNTKTLLLWKEKPLKFEYELQDNIVEIDKQYIEFHTVPSKVRQMKLPLYVLKELKKKIANLDNNIEVMLQITAIKDGNEVWHTIQKR